MLDEEELAAHMTPADRLTMASNQLDLQANPNSAAHLTDMVFSEAKHVDV